MTPLPSGVMPASITPFSADGSVDLLGIQRLLAWFRSHGCSGIVLAGTNGEGASLSAVEKRDLVRAAVPMAEGMPVVLGVATPSLDEAVWSCEQARKAGAAAALVMPPGFFREATDEGIAGWFESLLRQTTLPLVIYNFPKRTGITLTPELVARLAAHEGVAGFKDSSGDASNIVDYAQAAPGKRLYVGDETLLPQALEAGWSGTISGASNSVSRWIVPVVSEWESARESAETKFAFIKPKIEALRKCRQPVANKFALHRYGVIDDPAPRLPLLPLTPEEQALLLQIIDGL